MTLTVPCLFGLESLVADEMRRLNLKDVRAENGRVHCDGTLADIARLNISLRCGARVLMELGSFPARDFEALFQGVYALPWEDFIPRDGEFPVKGYSLNSQLHSVPACQAIVKKASARRLGEKYGLETLPESGSRYQIQFSIIKDVDKGFHGQYDIWGGDIDPAAVELAKHNAALAGVDDCIRFEVADAGKFRRDSEYGQLVTNPPYGERLLEKKEAEELYRAFGAALRDLPPKWRVLVLSSHTEFERCFGRSADKKRKLYNGMIKCDVVMYGK